MKEGVLGSSSLQPFQTTRPRTNGTAGRMVASSQQHLAACERAKQLIVFPSLLLPEAN